MPSDAASPPLPAGTATRFRAMVIGASAGGIGALNFVLERLRPDLPFAVLMVLHVGDEAIGEVSQLFTQSALPVMDAEDSRPIEAGHVYCAPAGYHLLVEQGEHMALSVDERVCYCRPSIDVLFESAAMVYRSALIGVILTGANEDGARGLRTLRELGGLALVQDPEEAEIAIMPTAAIALAGADMVAGLRQLADHVNSL